MTKRMQIPMTPESEELIKRAAKTYKISAAEWARRVLEKAAQRDLNVVKVLDPLEAVQKLSELHAPVGSVQEMKDESLMGRYK